MSSVSRHHAEWLSLVEVSGPFLSIPVLMRVLPQGLDTLDTEVRRPLVGAYEEWLEAGQKKTLPHWAWIDYVLKILLGFPGELLVEGQSMPPGVEANMGMHGETLRPNYALKHRDAGKPPVLLVTGYPASQDLEKPVAEKTWKATPGTRMMELLHAADVQVGLVTNGEHWMLVYASRGETTGFASWYADLWTQEPITLRAFVSLLHLRRFIGVAESDTLGAMLHESAKDQQEVTDQLGYQVRQAVEVLVQAIDRINEPGIRELLDAVDEKAIYDSALTVMMRLVFMFAAEERGMLLLGQNPIYDEHYALSNLRDELRERADQYGEEVLERRHDAWCRLLATFRAVHDGVEHESMRLPAYGGRLFDPDCYAFLEGRSQDTSWTDTPDRPLLINNRVVLHLLEALQLLRVKVSGGGPAEARRISFRALGIEQIGHVYEGLLDHTAKRATEVILGLKGGKDKEPEIPLTKLEERAGITAEAPLEFVREEGELMMAAERDNGPDLIGKQVLRAYDEPPPELIEFLKQETGRAENAIKKALSPQAQVDHHKLFLACNQDTRIEQRVRRFAGLLREDSFGQLVVIPTGSVYVTAGTDRRSSGTHYTPPSLTEPIVRHTLEPLVYVGPAEGKPENEWRLKSPKEILELKVCDMAMGSGAFLVQACRYLSERLAEAWEKLEKAHPGSVLATPEGGFSSGDSAERLIPVEPAERVAIARRYVADRCLYGVDINPMAVEMAKLSLWLTTLQRDRPFTFLDHAFKCGDSLLGVSSVRQIENFSLRPGDRQVTFATANLFRYVDEATAKRQALEDLPSNDHTQIETKNRLYAEAESATAKVKAIADCLIAFELRGLDGKGYEEQRAEEAERVQLLMKRDVDASFQATTPSINQLADHARELLGGRRPFHWSVEFPEVFARGGFDAFIGNPPFVGGRRIRQSVGDDATESLRVIWPHASLNADLCAFFYLRAADFLRFGGGFGFLGTKTIGQGDTARTGLSYLIDNRGFEIVVARSAFDWPGTAAVVAAMVVAFRGKWRGAHILNCQMVGAISAVLDDQGSWGDARILPENVERSFQGSVLVGLGFVLEPSEAQSFLSLRADNSEVVHPYLGGEDLNTHPLQQASRWAIDFRDYDLETCEERWPELLDRIRTLVKPQRDVVRREAHRNYWWHHGDKRPKLYSRIHGRDGVFVIARVTKYVTVVRVRADQVFHDKVYVFDLCGWGDFAALESSFHDTWVRRGSSTVGETLNYTPSDYFDTFPFLHLPQAALAIVGSEYHEFRRKIMQTRQEGLTKIYNRFHDLGEQSADIARLRALHVEMDQAVAAAYGWSDLDLGHGFHETKQGVRYTISETARREVLDRLLKLNHERYEEEIKAGMHDKKKGKKGGGTRGRTKNVVREERAKYGELELGI